jgi:hypothetical protein
MTRWFASLTSAIVIAVGAWACSGGSFGSTAMTATATAPTSTASVAVLSISSLSATLETTSTGFLYHVLYQLRETSGRSAANLTGISYALTNGTSTDSSLTGAVNIAAGSSLSVGPISITDNTGDGQSSQMTVNVTFTDDSAHASTATASSSVSAVSPTPAPAPATYTVSGVSDSERGQFKPAGDARPARQSLESGDLAGEDAALVSVTSRRRGFWEVEGECVVLADFSVDL